MGETLERLKDLGACCEARAWVGRRRSLRQMYDTCPRGDWLLWLAARLRIPRPLVIQAACDCARTALRFGTRGGNTVSMIGCLVWTSGWSTEEVQP